MTHDAALARAGHICKVKGVNASGAELLELAKFVAKGAKYDAAVVRAANIARSKGVGMSGGEVLEAAKFLTTGSRTAVKKSAPARKK